MPEASSLTALMSRSHLANRFQLALFWSTKPSFPVLTSRKQLKAIAVAVVQKRGTVERNSVWKEQLPYRLRRQLVHERQAMLATGFVAVERGGDLVQLEPTV
jgi:hypothetical protein